ncbi:hypothetical protein PSHT_04948, partial [Puccinia striiformis]
MSGRRSVSTTRLPQVDDPEAIIRKANTAKRLAAKAAVAQSQLPTTSTTLATTKEEPSPNRSEAPISNPLVAPAPLMLADNNQPRIDPAFFLSQTTVSPVDLLPTVDPASIPLPVDTLPSPFLRPRKMQNNEAPAPLGIEAGNNQPKDPLTQHPTGDNTPTGLVTGSSTRDLLRALLTCQQASVNQAMADRASWEDRLARTEAAKEAVIGVAIKAEDTLGSPRPTSNQVDHRRFKASEGPAYVGPYQEIEPFVVWMNAIELFFTAKDITLDRDRIIIAGERIKEPNLMGFYKTSASKTIDWNLRLTCSLTPSRWKNHITTQIRFIKMASNETFMQYTLRARTLQQLLNFDQLTISDHELAIGGNNLDIPTEDVSAETDDLDYLASISALAIVNEELSVTAADEASVALYAGIDPASVAALWEIPEDDSDEEEYVAYHPPSNRLLHQFHAGRCLRGRVNTGSSTRSMARVLRLIGHKKSLPIDNQLSLDQFTIPIHSSVPTFLVCSFLFRHTVGNNDINRIHPLVLFLK